MKFRTVFGVLLTLSFGVLFGYFIWGHDRADLIRNMEGLRSQEERSAATIKAIEREISDLRDAIDNCKKRSSRQAEYNQPPSLMDELERLPAIESGDGLSPHAADSAKPESPDRPMSRMSPKSSFAPILQKRPSSFAAAWQPVLVETHWLAANLKKVKPVYVGFTEGNDRKKFEKKHIPRSVYMAMGELMSALRGNKSEPHQSQFENLMRKLGVTNTSNVVLYGSPPSNPFVPAAYWLMKYFGHEKVIILNGSLEKWVNERRETVTGRLDITPSNYTVEKVNPDIYADVQDVMNALKSSDVVIIDTRGVSEYNGQEKRSYIKSAGHIPGAVNLNFYPSNRISDGSYKSTEELEKSYAQAGVSRDKEIIAYCESGPRAADTYFVLKHLLHYPRVRVYVGSWMEWGNNSKYPLVK